MTSSAGAGDFAVADVVDAVDVVVVDDAAVASYHCDTYS